MNYHFVFSLRTKVNLQFFPKIFCCYFYLYHIYFFSNPFGFGYVSLAGLYLFTLHAMMYFMNVYEIPALVTGVVGPTRMRLGLVDYAPAVNINSPVRVEQRLGRANSQNSRNMQSTVRLSAVRSSAQSDGQCRRPGPLTSLLDESNDNRQAQQRRHRSLLENNPMEETDLRLTLDGDVDLPMQLLKNEAPIGPAFDVRESNKAANGLRERPSVETIPSSRAMSSSARQELDRISQSYCVEKRSVSNRGVESPLGYCLDDEIIFENPPTNHRKSRIHAASWTDSGTDGDIMKRSDQEISMDGNLSRGRGFTVSVPRIAPIHKAAETPPATFVAANIYETLDARRNRLQQIEVNNMKKMSPKKDSFKVPSIESDSKSSNSEDPSTKLFCRFASGLAEMNDSALSVHKEDTNNSETNLSIEASDEVKSGKKPAKNIDSEKSTAGQAVSSDDTCFDNNPIREGAKHHVKFEDEYHSVTASQTTANVGEIKNVGKNSSAQSGMKQIPSEGSIEGKYGRECSDFYMFGSDSYYYDSEEGY